MAGRPVNIASPKQLQETAVQRIEAAGGQADGQDGAEHGRRRAGGVGPLHPLPAKILAYRQYAKLKSTYVDALPELIYPETGRVHASFNK